MNDVEKARSITLDELITTASRSTLKTYRELTADSAGKRLIPPKIWVGIWIDPSEQFKQLTDLGTDVGNP